MEHAAERRRLESLSRADLTCHQVDRLNQLLAEILPANAFYAEKLRAVRRPVGALAELRDWPYTFKDELVNQSPGGGYANNLTYPLEQYSRFHQTSGTRGRPMIVLDTASDWRWFHTCWQFILDAAEVTPHDRVLMAFSFGPFIGFWAGYDAFASRGCLVVPGGGLSTLARLELLRTSRATIVCCTPSYALHMAEIAAEHQIHLPDCGVRAVIVAGEPGGSIPAVRARIESAWGTKVVDHSGATEIGPWGYGELSGGGLHVMENEFIAEFRSLANDGPAAEGALAELVLTCLGRRGSPVIRYRTGDLVRPVWNHTRSRRYVFLDGGVIGRVDDMLIIRGVNIFPTAIDQVLRSFPEVVEYRITAYKRGALDQLKIEVEDRLSQPERIADELNLRLGLHIQVELTPPGTLPRFEAKAKRFIDRRQA